jgi:diadenosine tetraphosphate (Ap4A) HIT family hydrolase
MDRMTFILDPRLASIGLAVGDFPLCRVLLMNDRRWPWLMLVPMREGIVELTDLRASDRALLIEETASAADFLKAHTGARKINLGALGNVVPQFHQHVVARSPGDPAWPGPVWGQGAAQPYEEGEEWTLIEAARRALAVKAPG